MAPVSLLEELSKRAARFSINLNGQVVLQQTTRPLSGASASVYQGLLRSNGIRVAVKIFHSRPLEDMVTLKRILHEVHLWSKLRHENIVPMLGISTDFNSTISIISEWMGLGNAYVYVQNQSNDPRPLLIDIASGLHYLHTHPSGAIFHGDLKGLNVLVSHDRRALLTDFGFSKLDNSSFSMTVELPWGGSLPWMSPERLENADISAESDVWAFGMTTLELLTRLTPFHDCRNNQSLINRILLGQLPDRPSQELTCFRMTDEWWEMCLSCWKRDPKSRLPVSEVMVNRNVSELHFMHSE
ncbi:hypothetical protein ID866_9315 [Astraeus odoratus]|nr:hypothetical protein ID866_9315 [Astraeus odoratus]